MFEVRLNFLLGSDNLDRTLVTLTELLMTLIEFDDLSSVFPDIRSDRCRLRLARCARHAVAMPNEDWTALYTKGQYQVLPPGGVRRVHPGFHAVKRGVSGVFCTAKA